MHTLLEELQSLESVVNYRQPPGPSGSSFAIERRSRKVLVSAPHGSAHMRKGQLKPEEEFTTAFARYLAKKTDASAIYTTSLQSGDPNWDQVNQYKLSMENFVREEAISFVIDLHGMTNRHGFSVAIGTMNGKSCPQQEPDMLNLFKTNGFQFLDHNQDGSIPTPINPDRMTLVVNHPKFTGGIISHTVTRFATDSLGIPAVQIELASRIRIVEREAFGSWPAYSGKPEAIRQAIDTLSALILAL